MKKPGRQAKQWDEQLGQRLQQEPPFEPAAWEAMQAKLDKSMPVSFFERINGSNVLPRQVQKRRRMPLFWFAVAASLGGLLILAGLWWGLRPDGAKEIAGQRGTAASKVTESQEIAPENPAGAANEQLAAGTAKTTAKAASENGVPLENLSGAFGNSKSEKEAVSSSPSVTVGAARQKAKEKSRAAQPLAFRHQAYDLAGEQQPEGRTPPGGRENKSMLRAEKISFQYISSAEKRKEPLLPPVDFAPDSALAAAEPVVPEQNKRRKHRWSIALAGAPDLSQVGSLSTTRAGWGGGLLLGYQLGSRLRIQAGAVYTKKNYQSYDDFVPYEGLGSGYYAPEYIDASCGVLDLPLNVQYQFARGKRFRWYAATGLSSYLMLSEYYNFQYRYYNYEYSYKNENRHWLGVLNAGVGIEAPLFNGITLQAEPYFKLPLHGVGAGQIRLTSFGVLLQLRYVL